MPLSLVVCTAGTPASNLLFPILAHRYNGYDENDWGTL